MRPVTVPFYTDFAVSNRRRAVVVGRAFPPTATLAATRKQNRRGRDPATTRGRAAGAKKNMTETRRSVVSRTIVPAPSSLAENGFPDSQMDDGVPGTECRVASVSSATS
jgi:hypothetical protein